MAEQRVATFLQEQNKPFNAQGIADHLAQYGVKKTQIQKCLDSLAEAGKITCKEFGKTKIYLALQDGLQAFSKEELADKQEQLKRLNNEAVAEDEAVRACKAELQTLQSQLTLAEMQKRIGVLRQQAAEKEAKLAGLRSGAKMVSAEERAAVQKELEDNLLQWTKRKRMFKNVWGEVSEHMPGKTSELFAEIGVETDEDAGHDIAVAQALLPSNKRRKI